MCSDGALLPGVWCSSIEGERSSERGGRSRAGVELMKKTYCEKETRGHRNQII